MFKKLLKSIITSFSDQGAERHGRHNIQRTNAVLELIER